jgi:hypothetical protein
MTTAKKGKKSSKTVCDDFPLFVLPMGSLLIRSMICFQKPFKQNTTGINRQTTFTDAIQGIHRVIFSLSFHSSQASDRGTSASTCTLEKSEKKILKECYHMACDT